jgi:hypothetical protein
MLGLQEKQLLYPITAFPMGDDDPRGEGNRSPLPDDLPIHSKEPFEVLVQSRFLAYYLVIGACLRSD